MYYNEIQKVLETLRKFSPNQEKYLAPYGSEPRLLQSYLEEYQKELENYDQSEMEDLSRMNWIKDNY